MKLNLHKVLLSQVSGSQLWVSGLGLQQASKPERANEGAAPTCSRLLPLAPVLPFLTEFLTPVAVIPSEKTGEQTDRQSLILRKNIYGWKNRCTEKSPTVKVDLKRLQSGYNDLAHTLMKRSHPQTYGHLLVHGSQLLTHTSAQTPFLLFIHQAIPHISLI